MPPPLRYQTPPNTTFTNGTLYSEVVATAPQEGRAGYTNQLSPIFEQRVVALAVGPPASLRLGAS